MLPFLRYYVKYNLREHTVLPYGVIERLARSREYERGIQKGIIRE